MPVTVRIRLGLGILHASEGLQSDAKITGMRQNARFRSSWEPEPGSRGPEYSHSPGASESLLPP
jgi:hypothetical protein